MTPHKSLKSIFMNRISNYSVLIWEWKHKKIEEKHLNALFKLGNMSMWPAETEQFTDIHLRKEHETFYSSYPY